MIAYRRALAAGGLALALAGPAAAQSPTVEGKEFAFAPATIEVPAGETTTITFENVGRLSHNLTIPALDAASGTIQAGNTARLTLAPETPGRYEIRCSVPGHAPAGMTGTLIVTE
jgi:plastocyanin